MQFMKFPIVKAFDVTLSGTSFPFTTNMIHSFCFYMGLGERSGNGEGAGRVGVGYGGNEVGEVLITGEIDDVISLCYDQQY